MLHYCQGRKTVVFLPLIKISQEFCDILRSKGFRAAEVNGTSPDREEILQDFENGAYDVLGNAMLLTEGWDCPSVDCIVVLRPTKIRSLYQQMVGRGMRPSPGKENLLLLDFLWLTERHDLCKSVSLVSETEEIAEKISDKLAEGDCLDLFEAEETAKQDVVQERKDALAQQLKDMQTRKKKLIDPLQYSISIANEDLMDYEPTFMWEKEPPTQKQLKALEKFGIKGDTVSNKGYAVMLLDRLIQRSKEGYATVRQINCLERYGFQDVGTWKFKDANAMISELVANHWRLPYSPDEPMEGPLQLVVTWCFPCGKSHKSGEWKATKPDTDNLQKLLKDVMTQLGFWKDDALVASETIEKFWAKEPGIWIRIESLVTP